VGEIVVVHQYFALRVGDGKREKETLFGLPVIAPA
jgi:hypothetical protein